MQQDSIRHLDIKDQKVLALHLSEKTLTLLDVEKGRPVSRFHVQSTAKEVQILLALFDSYPSCCPYAIVFSYYKSPSTDEQIEQYRKQFEEIAGAEAWEIQLRNVRSTLSRLRLKLQHSGICIKTVEHTGYQLDTTSL